MAKVTYLPNTYDPKKLREGLAEIYRVMQEPEAKKEPPTLRRSNL